MILFLRFRRATLLLTRGMDRSLHHQQTLETELVGLRHQRGFAQPALPLGVLLGQDVPLVRVVAAQPTGPGEPDALAERALGFLFRHILTKKRSEEHTSELQSRPHLVCRLLLEKKKQLLSPDV